MFENIKVPELPVGFSFRVSRGGYMNCSFSLVIITDIPEYNRSSTLGEGDLQSDLYFSLFDDSVLISEIKNVRDSRGNFKSSSDDRYSVDPSTVQDALDRLFDDFNNDRSYREKVRNRESSMKKLISELDIPFKDY